MKIRNGQYGDFWGCTGYGIRMTSAKVTIKGQGRLMITNYVKLR